MFSIVLEGILLSAGPGGRPADLSLSVDLEVALEPGSRWETCLSMHPGGGLGLGASCLQLGYRASPIC